MKEVYYFGTDTRSAGHYFALLNTHHGRQSLSFPEAKDESFKGWEFDPEEIAPRSKGEVYYLIQSGWKIIAIGGSPVDGRPGCKSVFFTKQDISFLDFKKALQTIPAAKAILDKMPFKINWGLKED